MANPVLTNFTVVASGANVGALTTAIDAVMTAINATAYADTFQAQSTGLVYDSATPLIIWTMTYQMQVVPA